MASLVSLAGAAGRGASFEACAFSNTWSIAIVLIVSENSHLDDAFTGQLRRHLPLVCGDVLVSSVVAKQVHNVQVVPLRRPVQSCPPIDVVLRVRVHSPGEEDG